MTERTILHACVLPRESMCARRCVLLCTRTPGHTRQVTRHVCMHICPRTGDTSPYECTPEPAQGLEEGIVGMRTGGIRKLTIPLEQLSSDNCRTPHSASPRKSRGRQVAASCPLVLAQAGWSACGCRLRAYRRCLLRAPVRVQVRIHTAMYHQF